MVDALVTDPRRRESTRVMIGGRAAWTVPSDLIARLGLVEGAALTGDVVRALEAGADEEGAFRAAMRSLERRGHAARELGNKLERKGHPSTAVDGALTRLKRLGLLNDVIFARDYARVRVERGIGVARIEHDLLLLGVARDVVMDTLKSLPKGETDPLERPRTLAQRRASKMAGLPRETRHRRLSAFLARRGFKGEERRKIVEEIMKGELK